MAARTVAGFDSRCSVCQKPIFEGDEIVYLEDDEEWVHAECEDDA